MQKSLLVIRIRSPREGGQLGRRFDTPKHALGPSRVLAGVESLFLLLCRILFLCRLLSIPFNNSWKKNPTPPMCQVQIPKPPACHLGEQK